MCQFSCRKTAPDKNFAAMAWDYLLLFDSCLNEPLTGGENVTTLLFFLLLLKITANKADLKSRSVTVISLSGSIASNGSSHGRKSSV